MIVVVVMLVVVVMMMMVMMMLSALRADLTVMLRLLLQALNYVVERVLAFHCFEQLLAVKALPICRNECCVCIMLTDKCYAIGDLFVRKSRNVTKHYTACVFDLVVEELSEVLHVHFAFLCVNNCGKCVQYCVLILLADSLDSTYNVAELSDSRRLDYYSVG